LDSRSSRSIGFEWICAAFLTGIAVSLGSTLPPWVWMWALALALFAGAKLVMIARFLRSGGKAGRRLAAFALFWPGMDVRAFCGCGRNVPVAAREWAFAGMKTLAGVAIIGIGLPLMRAINPLITGWLGMIGITFILHFGFFHLLSLCWRSLGIDARPIMQSPATATSLSQFWGGRWNAGFSDLVHENLFKPLFRTIGARGALFVVFFVSGALHELVIAVPARGGYGLPTAYFLLQGVGVLFERSEIGRKMGIRSGWRGWCFVAVVAGLPAFLLFPPVFIRDVILPMLHSIGAT
jgi:alginate O-acetyltransferase complex protein AlgI